MRYLIFLLFIVACNQKKQVAAPEVKGESLETMIGQMLMVGFRGFTADEVSDGVKEDLRSGRIGNVILFDYDVVRKEARRNIESPKQVQALISELQRIAPVKLLVAVDQEGGRVNRLKTKYGFPASVSNEYLGELNNLDSTRYYAARNAHTLRDVGFNVNFSPDVDLNINPENPVIGKIGRSYGSSPGRVIQHAEVWIEEHEKQGILSTLKHFPGHGSSHSDSHYGITDITEYWSEAELLPFETLAQKKGVGIMTAHVVNKQLDTVPATLSKKIIKGIIRDQWKFTGLLFSDDLHMGAVNDLYDFETILRRSIEADVDILVFGNNLKYDEKIPGKVIAAVSKMIENGVIKRERIQASYDRIMKVKSQLQ